MKAITNLTDNTLEKVLKSKLADAKEIIFCVSFIKNSGVELLFNHLKLALKNNAKVSILTSTYLNVTEPIALYRLKALQSENFNLSIFDHNKLKTSFHVKGYYFKFPEAKEEMIIGSSNISRTALTAGIEWNIIFDNQETISDLLQHYEYIKNNFSFKPSDEWLNTYFTEFRPPISEFSFEHEEEENNVKVSTLESDYEKKYLPIKCQIPALYELERTRAEGFDKALIIMATGLGKTFLSAFDSKTFKRILFVAHREEILSQAKETFKLIRPESTFGNFNADIKNTDKDIIFASIATIGKSDYLNSNYFTPDYFDYIIVDEFHHSAAPRYLKFLDYFQPKFLLGLTATPDRLDNKDIYQYCDYNIAFECNFHTAINNGWLVPFSYFAIYDEVDYDNIPWRSGKYDLEALENAYMIDKRSNNIIKNYHSKAGKHTVAFCCSIKHADYTAQQFRKKNIKALALHSGSSNRTEVVNQFRNGEIQVICVVDIFNEGVDIPHIDTVMFLRPTESFSIFIQQLGRGLRTNHNKEKLVVMDFVGNYKNSHLKLSYLTGLTPRDLETVSSLTPDQALLKLPIGCTLDLDLELIDLFKFMRKEKMSRADRLLDNYLEILPELNNPNSLAEFNSASAIPARIYLSTFGSWLDFLNQVNPEELFIQKVLKSKLAELLSEIEKTSMTKLYKMPTILALIKENKLHPSTSIADIVKSFRNFYHSPVNAKDLADKSNQDYQKWTDQDWAKLALKNPVHFLATNRKSIFNYDEESEIFSLELNDQELDFLNQYSSELASLVKDRINYRREDYVKRKKYNS